MDYEPLDAAILAVLPEHSEVLSVAQHGSTNWSTGLRVDVQDGDDERSYFVKIIEREELVGMAEAEYEGQKAIASVIPDNAVKPVAWGYFSDTKAKAWFMAEFSNLRARAPPLEQFLPIVKQMHQKSVSPTGKFGFHVTPFYGPPPMVVDWTDDWEKFWVREFRSGLKYVESMRGHDADLLEIAENFIEKVAARLLRPLQTGGRNIKPSLCHGDLWDGNIQFNVDTQQPVIFDPCSFYGHHEMDFQCMKSPRYIIGQNFIDLYKVKVGASEPSEDFEDRIALYAIRNDLMTAGMWPQWVSLIDKAKDEMKLLLEKYPDGLDGFKGSLEPTIAKVDEDRAYDSASDDSGIDLTSSAQQNVSMSDETLSAAVEPEAKPADSVTYRMLDTPPETPSMAQHPTQDTSKGRILDINTPPETPSRAQHPAQNTKKFSNASFNTPPETLSSAGFPSHDADNFDQISAQESPDTVGDLADLKKANEKGPKMDSEIDIPESAAHVSGDRPSLPEDTSLVDDRFHQPDDVATLTNDLSKSEETMVSSLVSNDLVDVQTDAEAPLYRPFEVDTMGDSTAGQSDTDVVERGTTECPSVSKVPEKELSNTTPAKNQGQISAPAVDLEPPTLDKDITDSGAEQHLVSRESQAPEAASVNGWTLYNTFWYLVGKLNILV